jgi:hypothetical protein
MPTDLMVPQGSNINPRYVSIFTVDVSMQAHSVPASRKVLACQCLVHVPQFELFVVLASAAKCHQVCCLTWALETHVMQRDKCLKIVLSLWG